MACTWFIDGKALSNSEYSAYMRVRPIDAYGRYLNRLFMRYCREYRREELKQ